jgi:hypothetical protein
MTKAEIRLVINLIDELNVVSKVDNDCDDSTERTNTGGAKTTKDQLLTILGHIKLTEHAQRMLPRITREIDEYYDSSVY